MAKPKRRTAKSKKKATGGKNRAHAANNPCQRPSPPPSSLPKPSHTLVPSEPQLPLLRALNSHVVEERRYSSNALARIIAEGEEAEDEQRVSSTIMSDAHRKVVLDLLKDGVIRQLMNRVVDEDLQVRVAATGALRNLAIVGGETVCTQILEANVLLPVLSVLTQMHHKLVMNMSDAPVDPSLPQQTGEEKTTEMFFLELLQESAALLLSLCEISEKAVILFAQSEVPRLIWRYMDASLYPENLVLPLLQFVNTVTDDCPPTCSFIRNQTDGPKRLLTIQSNTEVSFLCRATATAVIFNIREDDPVPALQSCLPILQHCLKSCLSTVTSLHESLAPAVRLPTGNMVQQNCSEGAQCSQVENALKTIKLCLEVCTNMFTPLSYPRSLNQNQVDEDSQLPLPIAEVLLNSALLELVLECTSSPSSNILHSCLREDRFPTLAFMASQVQETALLCLGNVVLFVDYPLLTIDRMNRLWSRMWSLVFQQQLPPFVELSTNILFSIVRSNAFQHMELLSAENVNAVFELCNCPSPATQASAIGILGVLASSPNYVAAYQRMLLPKLASVLKEKSLDPSPSVVAESLNVTFDVFGADDLFAETVFREQQLLPQLKACLAHLQRIAQRDCDKLEDNLKERLDEAYENLVRFIQYKS